jgi:formylglycine-generating enzyme required for sulfatase activity
MATMYTQIPRAVMWLLRGDDAEIGGEGGDTEPAHTLELGPFYVSRGPISNEQYEAYDPQHPRCPSSLGDHDPVVNVSFADAHGYAEWYAELSKKPFRLPTEAEWEFGARAVGVTRFPWGDSTTSASRYAWTRENSEDHTHPVDTPTPSKCGLYSMIGNVWEWTASAYRPYPILPGDGRDAPELDEPRVIRGGSFEDALETLSSGRREARDGGSRSNNLGFRIVRSL